MPTFISIRKKKMPRNLFCRILFFTMLIALSPMIYAKSVSLETIPFALETKYGVLNVEIHFDKKDYELALRVEKIIRTDLIKIINYFEHVPKNIVHFNIDPYLRLTNGNARIFPTNIINLYKFPASNNEHLIVFEDWLRGLVFHEYTHITHLDQTRGFVSDGEKIFGSIAKIFTSITPRWFTEGIAVWSESHLMGDESKGRLGSLAFRRDFLAEILKKDACKKIACLDDPGIFPNGQFAYWAGAHFIEFIENKKPGTVKCLVEKNSKNFPFLLDHVFLECTGKNAQDLFDELRENLSVPEAALSGEKIINIFGSDSLEKGLLLFKNNVFKVEKKRQSEALVSYDLEDNISMLEGHYSYPIADLADTFLWTDGEEKDTPYLIVAFNEDPQFRKNNRRWKLINGETLLVEKNLPFAHDPSYVLFLKDFEFLTASYVENKWRIEKQKINFANNHLEKITLLYELPLNTNIILFKKEGSKIFLKINEENNESSLIWGDFSFTKLSYLYRSKNYYDIPVMTDSFVVIREGEKLSLLQFDGKEKILDKKVLSGISTLKKSDERALWVANDLASKKLTTKELQEFFEVKSGSFSTTKFEDVFFEAEKNQTQEIKKQKREFFPQWHHMRPYYWFLASGTSENLFSIGALTTFSDPMDINVVNATVLSYPFENKWGGNFDFNHKISSISDLFSFRGAFNREYSQTDFSNRVNETTEGTLGTSYLFLMKRWSLFAGPYVGASKTNDFISNRSTSQFGLSLVTQFQAMSFDDFFQSLIFQMKLQNDSPDNGKSFINLQSSLNTEVRFSERFVFGIKSTYGKLYKSGFAEGVLYGGGINSAGIKRWHEFYGVPYSNVYGNEIFTSRLYLDYNLWYANKGYGFFPFYLKEMHLLLGAEALSADRIILDERIFRDETIYSFFMGPRLKMNLFYFVPSNLDLIFSSIQKPNGGRVNQFQVGLNADLF